MARKADGILLRVEQPREQGRVSEPPFHEWRIGTDVLWAEFFRTPSGYLIRFPGHADFVVAHDGSSVTCHPCPELSDATREHLFLNQVRPLALGLQGALVFHGAAVAVERGALCFLGASGRGKSTLAAGFAARGHAFLSDDSLVLERTGPGYAVQPGHPSIRLFDDSSAAMTASDAPRSAPLAHSAKRRFTASPDLPFCDGTRSLRAAYVLGDATADDVMIRPLSGSDAVAAWVSHSFLLDIDDRAALAGHFGEIAGIARIVPCFRLDYPRRYEQFDRLVETVVAHDRELDLGSQPG